MLHHDRGVRDLPTRAHLHSRDHAFPRHKDCVPSFEILQHLTAGVRCGHALGCCLCRAIGQGRKSVARHDAETFLHPDSGFCTLCKGPVKKDFYVVMAMMFALVAPLSREASAAKTTSKH